MPNTDARIYLGIDPGTTLIGYGFIRDTGTALEPLDWGVIANPGTDSAADKQATRTALRDLILRWGPHVAGVEKLFVSNNQKTAMPVAEMRGVIMLTLADHAVPVHEFTPMQVKRTVAGHGQAKKPQVQQMVQMLLHIREPIRPDDAADALALALCCATVQKSY